MLDAETGGNDTLLLVLVKKTQGLQRKDARERDGRDGTGVEEWKKEREREKEESVRVKKKDGAARQS